MPLGHSGDIPALLMHLRLWSLGPPVVNRGSGSSETPHAGSEAHALVLPLAPVNQPMRRPMERYSTLFPPQIVRPCDSCPSCKQTAIVSRCACTVYLSVQFRPLLQHVTGCMNNSSHPKQTDCAVGVLNGRQAAREERPFNNLSTLIPKHGKNSWGEETNHAPAPLGCFSCATSLDGSPSCQP